MTALADTTAQAPAAPVEVRGRVPDFFIVGHPKCGTTALYEMLRRHPQIFMPALKEPAYFATDLRSRFQRKASGQLPVTLAQYLSLFDGRGAGTAGGGGLIFVSGVHRRGARYRRAAARGAPHRDPARARLLPALAAPAAAAEPHRDRARPAPGARAGARAASGPADSAPLAAPAGAALLRARALRASSCAATTICSDASGCWC